MSGATAGRARGAGGRRSSEERREEVIAAAVWEFGVRGYLATRTADIAKRAGVSQPYLYALFPDKRALFIACSGHVTAHICQTLRGAAPHAGEPYDDATLASLLGRAAIDLGESDPRYRRFQFQARAAAASDPEIRATVRASFMTIVDESVALHRGASRQEVLRHMAWAMLHDIAVALNLPPEYRPEMR